MYKVSNLKKKNSPQLTLICANYHQSCDCSAIMSYFCYYRFIVVSQTLFVFQYSEFLCCCFIQEWYSIQWFNLFCKKVVALMEVYVYSAIADKFPNSSIIEKVVYKIWFINGILEDLWQMQNEIDYLLFGFQMPQPTFKREFPQIQKMLYKATITKWHKINTVPKTLYSLNLSGKTAKVASWITVSGFSTKLLKVN